MTKSILIVEDDQDISTSLKEILEMQGYSIALAENGKVALTNLQSASNLPDLILLDYMMPVLNGQGFRDEQLKDLRLASIPVALMTADSNIDEKKENLNAIFAIKKPLELNSFLNNIEAFLSS